MTFFQKTFCLGFAILFLIPGSCFGASERSLPNPAVAYAEWLGYQVTTVTAADGSQHGRVGLPDGTDCDVWDFYKGKAGQAYSYCARKGYETTTQTRTVGSFTIENAVCKGSSAKGAVQIPMTELMANNQEPLLKKRDLKKEPQTKQIYVPDPAMLEAAETLKARTALPGQFDWRDINGHSYIGPIRDQGSCGSCYSFGAAAAAEGTFNFVTGNTDGNCVDFSESFIAWCLGRLPAYSAHFFGCDGADYEYQELEALTREGIILESAFPYTETDPGACTHMNDPATTFLAWGRLPSNDTDAIKAALNTYGVLDAAVDVTSSFEGYAGGVYTDTATTCPNGAYTPTNHAISLVGWGTDATVGDYWILRNSWGSSWGENGYMRIAVTSSRVGCEATYLQYQPMAPKANFKADPTTAPQGVQVQLSDLSTNSPTAWQWSISPATVTYENGTSSSSRNPVVSFSEIGTYTVTLTVSNALGSDSTTKTDYISVSDNLQQVRFTLTTDTWGSEVSWTLKDNGGTAINSGDSYGGNTTYTEDFYLGIGSYVFTILDSYGDGICCDYGNGDYILENITTGKIYRDSTGQYGASEVTSFEIKEPATGGDNINGWLHLLIGDDSTQ